MAEIKNFIEKSMQKIEYLNAEISQETAYLTFLRRWEKDHEEAEKIQNENAKIISELESKIACFEKKLKSRDSLLKKMDTKMNEMQNKNAAKISNLNSKVSSYELRLKSRDSLLKKMDLRIKEMKIENAAQISSYESLLECRDKVLQNIGTKFNDEMYIMEIENKRLGVQFDAASTCQICDEKYRSSGERIPCKLKCSHIFCRKCALDWIRAKVSFLCPGFFSLFLTPLSLS